MARRYSGSSRRSRTQKKRRGKNPLRTYGVVVIVIALGVYGIHLLQTSGSDVPEGSSNDEVIAATTLSPIDSALPSGPVDGEAAGTDATVSLREEVGAQSAEPLIVVREIPDNRNVNEAVSGAVSKFKQNPGGLVELRDTYNDILKTMEMSVNQRDGIQHQMEKLSGQWLFSKKVYPGDSLCETYMVQSGDILERIGRRHQVPAEILQNINDIPRPRDLQAGRKIKVTKGPFHAVVRRSAFMMDLYLNNTYVKSYQVGLGMPGRETPTGTWIVEEGGKHIRPQWTDPSSGRMYYGTDPDYPLGSRYIALQGIEGDAVGRTGFAIHGTEAPQEIGTNASRGCIRLHNGKVIEVYNMLMPGLSKVRVLD